MSFFPSPEKKTNMSFLSQLIFAHDTSRVIQCLMKYGTQEDKTAVFEELRGEDLHRTSFDKATF